MDEPRSFHVYGKAATVYLFADQNKFATMERAMAESGFYSHVETAWQAAGVPRDEFRIVIKPNIMTAAIWEEDSPIYTDPKLVEFLISKLRDRGFHSFAVVEARNVYDYSYRGRSVQAVAEMIGYTGDGYRIVDLSLEKEPFDYGGVLGRHLVGRTWRDAHYRISFAKNKTHWQCYYTGCLKNIYGALPEWDKMRHYHGKDREFFQSCIAIVDALPVHFGFLDAWVSGDGLSGHVRDARPNKTRTIFASDNIYALDWVQGEKMDVDPLANSVVAEALRWWGPIEIRRVGYMGVWPGWTNIKPVVIELLNLVEEWYHVSRFMSRAFASQQDPRFPPVSATQWLFGKLQAGARLLERIGLRAAAQPIFLERALARGHFALETADTEPPIALVTGANGFIGSHLVRALIARGYRVRGLVRSTSDLTALEGVPIDLRIGDVRKPETLMSAVTGVDYVFHLAAELLASSEEGFEVTNAQGTRNLLTCAEQGAGARLRRFLFVSSLAAAGPSPADERLTETDVPKPVSWYGLSKRKAEGIVGQYGEHLPVTIVRPAPVYGERERDLSQTFGLIAQGIHPRLGLRDTRTVMVYVADVVEGIIAAAESENTSNRTYFLNHPAVLTSTQVVKTIAAAMGRPQGITVPVPLTLMRLVAPLAEYTASFTRERPSTTRDKVRELAQHAWVADPSAARRDFGWEARHDLLQGMVPTTQYFLARQAEEREMAAESRKSRWLKYVTLATLLGVLIEISSATGKFYWFEPGWLVFVVIFGAFGLALGSVAHAVRRWSGLAQLAIGSVAAGVAELLNGLNLTSEVRWVFAPGWPLGIQDTTLRALVLGLAGGIFVLVVNAIMRAYYRRRLRFG
jgi:nucleoside-diphosphate-sugar epimerase/uncharacterized protein (DUF362 family)